MAIEPGYFTKYFNAAKTGDFDGLGFGFDNPARTEPAQHTLLASIAPDLNLNVAVDPVSIPVAHQEGAYEQACEAQVELSSTKENVERSLAAGMAAIKDAQGEILAAVRASGHDPAKVFPEMRMAPDTTLGMMANMVNGKGSIITAGQQLFNAAGLADDINKGMQGRSSDEVIKAIEDTLRAQSNSEHQNQSGFKGLIIDADAPPKMPGSSIDWNTVLDEHPEAINQIVYCDVNNPSPEVFPELAQLIADKARIDQDLAELEWVKDNAVDNPAKIAVAEAEMPANPVPQILEDMKKDNQVTLASFKTFEEPPPAAQVENIPAGVNVSTLPQSIRDMFQAEKSSGAAAGQNLENELHKLAKKFETSGPAGPTNNNTSLV